MPNEQCSISNWHECLNEIPLKYRQPGSKFTLGPSAETTTKGNS
jgi:hypothetical protein